MGNIPLPALGIRPPEQQDPLGQYGRLVALKNMLQTAPLQQELLKQQAQQGQVQLQTQQALGEAYKNAYAQPQGQIQPGGLQPSGVPDTGSIVSYLASHGGGAAIPSVVKSSAELQGLLDKHTEAVDKHIESQNDIAGSTGASLKQAIESGDDNAAQRIIADSARAYPDHAAQLQQVYSQGGLQALLPISKQLLAQSPKWQTIDNERIAAQARQISAENNIDYWVRQTQSPDPTVRAAAQKIVDAQSDFQATVARKTAEQRIAAETSPAAQAGKAAIAGAEAGARVTAETSPAAIAGAASKAGAEEAARVVQQNAPSAIAGAVNKAVAVQKAVTEGSDAALAGVPPHLAAAATSAAQKVGSAYAAALQGSDDFKSLLDLAKKTGNKVAYAYEPVAGVLQFNVAGGTKRINMAEIERYGAAGSTVDRIKGWLGGHISGASIDQSVLNDMGEVQKAVADNAKETYSRDLKVTNDTYGSKFKPVDLSSTQGPSVIFARDPQGKLHQAPAGTALPAGWKAENR